MLDHTPPHTQSLTPFPPRPPKRERSLVPVHAPVQSRPGSLLRIRAWAAQAPLAQQRLVAAHSGLVRSIARRFFGHGVSLSDLYHAGVTALLRAAATYNPTLSSSATKPAQSRAQAKDKAENEEKEDKEGKAKTWQEDEYGMRKGRLWALPGLRRRATVESGQGEATLQQEVWRRSPVFSFPRYAYFQYAEISAAYASFRKQHTREPTLEDLSAATSLSPQRIVTVSRAMRRVKNPLSFDVSSLPNRTHAETFSNDKADPWQHLLDSEHLVLLSHALSSLDPHRRLVNCCSTGDDTQNGVLFGGISIAAIEEGIFEIEIRPPAKWVISEKDAFVDLLIVELWGPSIAYAEVKKEGSDNTRWRVSYRVWDVGKYIATVISGCSNLNYTAKFAQQGTEAFANWTLTEISNWEGTGSRAGAGEQKGNTAGGGAATSIGAAGTGGQVAEQAGAREEGGRAEAEGQGEEEAEEEAEGEAEGGAEGEAEWRREAELELYEGPCRQSVAGRWLSEGHKYRWRFYPCASPLPPPSQWVEALQARGIREISFVGDSHQRFLMLFINYLVMHDVDDALWKFHGDIVINIPPPKERTDLKPLKMNFFWVDGTYQNGEYGCDCRGFWSHRNDSFPEFSDSADVTIIDGGFWAEIERYGIGYLDGWPVEAPRYFDTCTETDPHYTCHKPKQGTKNGMFFGDVGQAMVEHTIYTLLYRLQ
ncbi:unnamed protein product [Closterium sp. Yama58-4]|nr:unnamed protein product [Closterium sp. Yama58-4]